MKRLLSFAVICVSALGAVAATCVVTNESFTSIDEHDTFAGELHNDSGVDILFHKFQVAFLNANNAVVELRTVDGCLRSLQNGTSDFFSARSSLDNAQTSGALGRLANFAEDPAFKVGTTADGDIAISDFEASRTGASLIVTGKVTNNDNDELTDPAACVVVWDEDGRVVITAKDDALNDLDEDESDMFSVNITVPDDADVVDEVDVWVDGLEDGVPVDPASDRGNAIGLTPTPVTGTPTSTATPTVTPTPTM